ncbi:hypothetical protein SAMD00023353_3300930 [Rosellinia necatrix]|uniref:Uncharacterized protein n=1 Tax=Rosellinia necatrix TaxID=77044 RepID=A0A1W2TK42_ROSNE|nr:hypothetical protein SAMD00023353_3300930 [Rosellinia necatrix]
MASHQRNRAHDKSLRRRALLNIKDHHAKAKRAPPPIETISRKRTKTPSQQQPGRVIVQGFGNGELFDGAVSVFARLPAIPGLAGIVPRVCHQDRDRLELRLRCPSCGIWRVVDRLHSRGNRRMPRLQVHQVRQLRDTLLNDIRILCASRIAFSSDVTSLYIAQQIPVTKFIPLLDRFDFNMCASDADAIDWSGLERDMVRKVNAQFQVFESLANFESPIQSQEQSNAELDPGYTLNILQANPPLERTSCLVIQQVSTYTPGLARYIMRDVAGHLYELPKRTSLASRYAFEILTTYSNTVGHMLRLRLSEGLQPSISLLSGRACLHVLHAALLVHAYVSVIEVDDSAGLLQLDHPALLEPYTSIEGFRLITEAYHGAQEAIRALHDAGGKVGPKARYFLRDVHPASDLNRSTLTVQLKHVEDQPVS